MSPESETRQALVVATGRYSDPKFQQLRAPEADARALAAVLGDPAIGDFEVDLALDEEQPLLVKRIARFFANRRPDDLLFLHISGHGVKDAHGDLYLAATDSEFDLLTATAISAGWLNEQLSRTRSRRTVVLLDCCFSGSFPFGARARAGTDVNVPDQFEGAGRGLAVITASSAMEYAFEGDHLSGQGQPSFFTSAVVEALRSGEADRDQDRLISVDELYHYVHASVRAQTPSQTPNIKSELEGPLYLARSAYEPPVEPKQIAPELASLIENPVPAARLGAVAELTRLLSGTDRGLALGARQVLEGMLDDDSRRVSAAARASLAQLTEAEAYGEAGEKQRRTAGEPPRHKSNAVPSDAARQPPNSTAPLTKGDRSAVRRPVWGVLAAFERSYPQSGLTKWLSGYKGGVRAVSFSADGRHFADASQDGTIRIYDIEANEEVRRFTIEQPALSVKFSPDGQAIAAGGYSHTARVWETDSGVEIARLPHEDEVKSVHEVAFSPDGSRLATVGYDSTARVWQISSGTEVTRIDHKEPRLLTIVAFSPDGKRIATGGHLTKTARVWDLASRSEVLSVSHEKSLKDVVFSPDNTHIATAGDDATARIWDVSSGEELMGVTHQKSVWGVAFSPDGQQLVTASQDTTARVWAVPGGREVARLPHDDSVAAVAFGPDGRQLVTGTTGGKTLVWHAGSP